MKDIRPFGYYNDIETTVIFFHGYFDANIPVGSVTYIADNRKSKPFYYRWKLFLVSLRRLTVSINRRLYLVSVHKATDFVDRHYLTAVQCEVECDWRNILSWFFSFLP
jgi:hypothetical protein